MTTHCVTPHLIKRAAQRGISEESVRLAIQYGERYYEGTDIICFLGQRWIPKWIDEREHTRLNGTVVVLRQNAIVTCYKNNRYNATVRRRPVKGRSAYAYR